MASDNVNTRDFWSSWSHQEQEHDTAVAAALKVSFVPVPRGQSQVEPNDDAIISLIRTLRLYSTLDQ